MSSGTAEQIGKLSYLGVIFQRVESSVLDQLEVQPGGSGVVVDCGVIEPEHVLEDRVSVGVNDA